MVNRIEVNYHRITKIKPKVPISEHAEYAVWDYTESLIVDRESESVEHIQNIGSGCSVSRKYKVEGGVESLLEDMDAESIFDHIEGNPENVVVDPLETIDYTIKVISQKGNEKLIQGTYDKSELESGDTQKVQSYLDYREGRITKEDFIVLRSEREKRMEELKVQIVETEAAYEDFLEKENQTKQEQTIIERTSSMNDEALKELMYDAVERINVTDNQNIEIIWKFDDLFATA